MNFSAVILAGGRSSRMGRDKAFLSRADEPLYLTAVRTVRGVGAQEVFISGRAQVDYTAAQAPVLLDDFPDCGPLAGMERGLARASHPLLLVLAVDVPFADAALLRWILSRCTEERGFVPQCRSRVEPLVAVYSVASHRLAVECLQMRRLSVSAFAHTCAGRGFVSMEPVPAAFEGQFTNWNTPQDLAESSQ